MTTCHACRYWAPEREFNPSPSGGPKFGKCHRRAPVATGSWPVTEKDDWCGEYEGTPAWKTVQLQSDYRLTTDGPRTLSLPPGTFWVSRNGGPMEPVTGPASIGVTEGERVYVSARPEGPADAVQTDSTSPMELHVLAKRLGSVDAELVRNAAAELINLRRKLATPPADAVQIRRDEE